MLAALILITFTVATNSGLEGLEEPCRTQLDKVLRAWTMAPIPEEVRDYFEQEQPGLDPGKIVGDFDNDGRQDLALLIQNRAKPKTKQPAAGKAARVAVCLSRDGSPELLMIEDTYCSDHIYVMKKGDTFYNYETHETEKSPRDGVATVCFESAGAVFFLEARTFRRVINSY